MRPVLFAGSGNNLKIRSTLSATWPPERIPSRSPRRSTSSRPATSASRPTPRRRPTFRWSRPVSSVVRSLVQTAHRCAGPSLEPVRARSHAPPARVRMGDTVSPNYPQEPITSPRSRGDWRRPRCGGIGPPSHRAPPPPSASRCRRPHPATAGLGPIRRTPAIAKGRRRRAVPRL